MYICKYCAETLSGMKTGSYSYLWSKSNLLYIYKWNLALQDCNSCGSCQADICPAYRRTSGLLVISWGHHQRSLSNEVQIGHPRYKSVLCKWRREWESWSEVRLAAFYLSLLSSTNDRCRSRCHWPSLHSETRWLRRRVPPERTDDRKSGLKTEGQ